MTKQEFIEEYKEYFGEQLALQTSQEKEIKFGIDEGFVKYCVNDNNAEDIDFILKNLHNCTLSQNDLNTLDAEYFLILDEGQYLYILGLSKRENGEYYFSMFDKIDKEEDE